MVNIAKSSCLLYYSVVLYLREVHAYVYKEMCIENAHSSFYSHLKTGESEYNIEMGQTEM